MELCGFLILASGPTSSYTARDRNARSLKLCAKVKILMCAIFFAKIAEAACKLIS